MSKTADTLSQLGLPESLASLTARTWDVIIVGAGHNGLTCAAYLARAGKRVLVLEARDRVGGACTLEEPWPGYRISPCAYLCGLLHPLVIEELNLPARGFTWTPASSGMFIPFDDGGSIQLWPDEARCESEIRRFAPQDLDGWRAMGAVKTRLRDAIRPPGQDDLWIGSPPFRDQIEDRLQGDPEATNLLFNWSMVEFVEHYLTDERLQSGLLGQGVIGTNASPHDPGTASVHFHHASGRLGGLPGEWGYVKGGMGQVSFMLCDAAQDAGTVVATGVPVARILPGKGIQLTGGEILTAPAIVSNADPCTTLNLLEDPIDSAWKAQIEAIPMTGCTVKLNVALSQLPNFMARPGTQEPHHLGQINIPLTKTEWQTAFETARSGHIPDRLWAELYFQSAYDSTVAPNGKHVMSVFAQYVPYAFDWNTHRETVGQRAIASIARFCSNLPGIVVHVEIMGPPDIEQKIGLTGGHIFQGDCLPDYMWDKRLAYRTPIDGLFLCGACTHPGGSVTAINGRNAAMEILNK